MQYTGYSRNLVYQKNRKKTASISYPLLVKEMLCYYYIPAIHREAVLIWYVSVHIQPYHEAIGEIFLGLSYCSTLIES